MLKRLNYITNLFLIASLVASLLTITILSIIAYYNNGFVTLNFNGYHENVIEILIGVVAIYFLVWTIIKIYKLSYEQRQKIRTFLEQW